MDDRCRMIRQQKQGSTSRDSGEVKLITYRTFISDMERSISSRDSLKILEDYIRQL